MQSRTTVKYLTKTAKSTEIGAIDFSCFLTSSTELSKIGQEMMQSRYKSFTAKLANGDAHNQPKNQMHRVFLEFLNLLGRKTKNDTRLVRFLFEKYLFFALK